MTASISQPMLARVCISCTTIEGIDSSPSEASQTLDAKTMRMAHSHQHTHTHTLSLDTHSLRLVSSPSILQFRYLSNEQVLADYAQLLQSLAPSDGSVGPPVVAIGGSYGGMLAVYLRLKYPWLVAGALGSSAPIAGGPGACLQGCAQFRKCVKRAQTACSAVF